MSAATGPMSHRSLRLRQLCRAAAAAAGVLLAVAGAAAAETGEAAFTRHDYARAAAIFRVGATQGRATAQSYLGYLYSRGLGAPRDFAVAAQWWRAAADQGEPTAQFFLGLAYDKGQGAPQDFVTAEVWLILAAAKAPAQRREYWARIRDAVAGKLSLAELRQAQAYAVAWRPIADP
ncbi:MAG: tetratricopeptide repeat protein [Roseiarcus sp.]|jgi:TPR repeat protein